MRQPRRLTSHKAPLGTRGRHAPAPHHQGSAHRGHHRWDGPPEPPRETLDDGARGQSSSWDEFRAAIDSTWEDFTAAHATARGTHNPSMIGDMPNVDVLTRAWNVQWAEASVAIAVFDVEGIPIPTASLETLIASKRTGRPQDTADILVLEAMRHTRDDS